MNSIEARRGFAQAALAAAVIAAADVDALVALLGATPAQSADDRGDDICAVYARGPLTGADVSTIEGRPAAYLEQSRKMLGASYDKPQAWTHSWTRRRVRRGGAEVILSQADWLRENALAILRAGAVEVKTWRGDWVRVASADVDYRAIALAAAAQSAAA